MSDLRLANHLDLDRCPFCGKDHPTLARLWNSDTKNSSGAKAGHWAAYMCARCGGVVTAVAAELGGCVSRHFPQTETVPADLPERAAAYLKQAIDSLHSPAGAVMLAASAVDAMLRAKDLKTGLSTIESTLRLTIIS